MIVMTAGSMVRVEQRASDGETYGRGKNVRMKFGKFVDLVEVGIVKSSFGRRSMHGIKPNGSIRNGLKRRISGLENMPSLCPLRRIFFNVG